MKVNGELTLKLIDVVNFFLILRPTSVTDNLQGSYHTISGYDMLP